MASRTNFFSLPLEIRQQIYQLVFWRPCVPSKYRRYNGEAAFKDFLQDVDTALFTVSKRIYNESFPHAIACNAFDWPGPETILEATPDATLLKLDNIVEVVISFQTLANIVDEGWLAEYKGCYAELMKWYFPRKLKYLTVDAKAYTHPCPSDSDNNRGFRMTAWLEFMPHLLNFRNVKVLILRRQKRNEADDGLEKDFPGMIVREEEHDDTDSESDDVDIQSFFGDEEEIDDFDDFDEMDFADEDMWDEYLIHSSLFDVIDDTDSWYPS